MTKLVDLLVKTTQDKGWNVHDANICVWMLENKQGKATQMEQELRMRQPQVSISTKKLCSLGLLSTSTEPKTGGKGRPLIQYHFNEKGFRTFIEQLDTDLEEKISDIQNLRQMFL